MKNLFKRSAAVLIVALLISASVQKGNDNPIPNQEPPFKIKLSSFLTKPGEIKLSQMVENISYISLKTPEETPMDMVRNVYVKKKNIFVIDRSYSIFIFDKSGKFIRKINHAGRGPGEYSLLLFTYNEDKELIVIGTRGKVLFYDMNDKLINSININELFSSIEWLSNDLYVLKMINFRQEGDPSAMSTIVLNGNGEVITQHKYYVTEKPNESVKGFEVPRLFKCNEGVLVSEQYNDTTYLITKDCNRIPYLIFDYGEYKASRHEIEGPPPISVKGDMKHVLHVQTALCSKYVYIQFWYKGVQYFGIWDLLNKKAMKFPFEENFAGIEDDLDNGIPFVLPYDFNGTLLDLIYPQKLMQSTNKPRKGSDLEALSEVTRIDDNPIIRIFTVKQKIQF